LSKELEALEWLEVLLNFYGEEYIGENGYETIKQALTPTPLNELRDEIISELNEWFKCELFENPATLNFENTEKFANDSKGTKHKFIGIYDKLFLASHNLPLKLAHKITTYFMRLEE